MIKLLQGDCREQLRGLPDASVDSIVTDPPYELGFMGRKWDASGIAYDGQVWAECLRVLKPGGHLLAFGGTRTYHRMTCAIEDAGFEIRDCIMWVYGSGFPKSHDVSKAIDKAAGAERSRTPRVRSDGKATGKVVTGFDAFGLDATTQYGPPATEAARQWQGWGSALKPAVEPIVVARKPLEGTIAENVLAHGTGAINVDKCRVEAGEGRPLIDGYSKTNARNWGNGTISGGSKAIGQTTRGRWPANLIHDGSQEVVELFPETSSGSESKNTRRSAGNIFGSVKPNDVFTQGDSGSAARFFYCAKTSPSERGDNRHPTVKPIALMRYLCRLVTPPKGVVLDPFAGSGTTLVAARAEGFDAIGCELMPEHIEIIKRRLDMPLDPVTIEDKVETEQPTNTIKDKPVQLKLLL